jgi:uncharacterized membrane protein YkvA (DUF1232 family)
MSTHDREFALPVVGSAVEVRPHPHPVLPFGFGSLLACKPQRGDGSEKRAPVHREVELKAKSRRMARILTRIRREIRAVTLAAKHPRTPKGAKWLAGALVAYALSPIDLIPDFIPVLGHLDDAIVLPIGVWLLWRMVPSDVRAECRAAALNPHGGRHQSNSAASAAADRAR